MRPTIDSIVQTVALRLSDKKGQYGEHDTRYIQAVAEATTAEIMRFYSEEEARQYLDRLGMKPNVVKLQDGSMKARDGNRPFVKKGERIYNDDGTYWLGGVLFGEKRTDLIDKLYLGKNKK
jgi:hypothetical protein